jgi:hypothetical protein
MKAHIFLLGQWIQLSVAPCGRKTIPVTHQTRTRLERRTVPKSHSEVMAVETTKCFSLPHITATMATVSNYFYHNKKTRWDNLIPRMTSLKQNLHICALCAAIAFEMLALWRYALRETVVPLQESPENHIPEYLAYTLSCWLDLKNVSKSLSLEGIL